MVMFKQHPLHSWLQNSWLHQIISPWYPKHMLKFFHYHTFPEFFPSQVQHIPKKHPMTYPHLHPISHMSWHIPSISPWLPHDAMVSPVQASWWSLRCGLPRRSTAPPWPRRPCASFGHRRSPRRTSGEIVDLWVIFHRNIGWNIDEHGNLNMVICISQSWMCIYVYLCLSMFIYVYYVYLWFISLCSLIGYPWNNHPSVALFFHENNWSTWNRPDMIRSTELFQSDHPPNIAKKITQSISRSWWKSPPDGWKPEKKSP